MDPVLYVQHHRVGMYRDYAEDGSPILRAYPSHRLTVPIKIFIRDHKDEILRCLDTPDLDYTVGNILALERQEFEDLCIEIEANSPNEQHYEHDTEALRRAEIIIAKQQVSTSGSCIEKAS